MVWLYNSNSVLVFLFVTSFFDLTMQIAFFFRVFIICCIWITCSPGHGQEQYANKYRVWEVGGEKHVAKFERLDDDRALFKTIDNEDLTIEFSRLSSKDREICQKLQAYVSKISDKASSRVKSIESESIQAKVIVESMRSMIEQDRLTPEDRVFLESRIEFLKPHASTDMVRIEGEYVDRDEINSMRNDSQEAIQKWMNLSVLEKDPANNIKLLKQAVKSDPVGNEAPLLLGLYFTFWERDYGTADRNFLIAIKRYEQYQEIYDESGKANHIVALNNHAASLIRKDDAKRAAGFFRIGLRISGTVDAGIYWNLQRVCRVITTDEGLGIKVNKAVGKSLFEMRDETDLNRPDLKSRLGATIQPVGWIYRIPQTLGTADYDVLSFLIQHPGFASAHSGAIEDFACIDCGGTGVFKRGRFRDRCPMCNKGRIKR